MAVIIAGDRSGVGKTTVTLALLAALRQWGTVQSFKVGPDYIDPMFHTQVTGRSCRNLDPVLTSESYVERCFRQHRQTADFGLVEGVMGLFDGAGSSDYASTAHIARLLDLPILLVLDCSRMARSIAALVHGFRSFDPRLKFAGVVLNRVGSDRHLELLQAALEPINLPILGVLRRQAEITIPDRHLGLVPTEELPQMQELIDRLAVLGKESFDWGKLLPLMKGDRSQSLLAPVLLGDPAPNRPLNPPYVGNLEGQIPRIGVARDRAFSFYYADNLDLLERLGAELVYWSPLTDELPAEVNGLYFGGGFPEMFAAELQANAIGRAAVRSTIVAGMPTYAECGGLMYLSQSIMDFEGRSWEMAGILPTVAQMGKRLTLGYRQAAALQNSPFMQEKAIVWGHEFHRSTLTQLPKTPLYQIRGYDATSPATTEGWHMHQAHASYVHLHWGDRAWMPHNFLQACLRFGKVQPGTF
ncbi:cobyrinate a,c-diamide synthase [Leptolyngbya ohadii]|uniref:cobyrinate a,c-diamide synthase n=1 Tax=Leptolyngbya ohadii TaxID=1962290 RepID=UPI000B59B138|nr:cobyrinate a,c-diamide synthase [Leptolyngbya ohadii]